jgi:anti-sigma28 factor (negative regulator of flagellin synthesis)
MIQQIAQVSAQITKLPTLLAGKQRLIAVPETETDSYEPAAPLIRKDLIASIKSRIKDGFYNTEEVIDDLSDSFAKAFNMRP